MPQTPSPQIIPGNFGTFYISVHTTSLHQGQKLTSVTSDGESDKKNTRKIPFLSKSTSVDSFLQHI